MRSVIGKGVKEKFCGDDVTIVICAYEECKYLEASIRSVLEQSVKTRAVISTSTPNEFIYGLADKYSLEVWVNKDGGHSKDFNFAIKTTTTALCIMAHQDDLLHPDFVKKSLQAINASEKPIIAFTDYKEMHEDKIDDVDSQMVRIKKLLLWPMKIRWLSHTVFGKRICQCLGNTIPCPSVTYIKAEMPETCFSEQYQAVMDWDLWERLSRQPGRFVYVNEVLHYHRMYSGTTTAKLIKSSNYRYKEDYEMLCRFWPAWIAKAIMHFYKKAQAFY